MWRGNDLPSAASFCIQHGGFVSINFWTTSCCTCKTHVGRRASNNSTRTLQKRRFDFRFLRFRRSVLRVWRDPQLLRQPSSPTRHGTAASFAMWSCGHLLFPRARRPIKTCSFVVGVANNFSNSSSSVMSNSGRLASVGRMMVGSSSLLICSTSEASAAEPVREKVCEPSQPKLSNSVEETSEEASPQSHPSASLDAQANHIHETCQHLKL